MGIDVGNWGPLPRRGPWLVSAKKAVVFAWSGKTAAPPPFRQLLVLCGPDFIPVTHLVPCLATSPKMCAGWTFSSVLPESRAKGNEYLHTGDAARMGSLKNLDPFLA